LDGFRAQLSVEKRGASRKAFAYDVVRSFLKTIVQPDFIMKFDNIAAMKKVDGKLVVDRI